ncbi:MAG: corrinoid protein [Chloroflexi bacterium]|nr:corrinoid protein [Chloroflexota bacterium]
MNAILAEIYESVLNGQMEKTIASVKTAVDTGMDPETILKTGMISAISEVGRLYEDGEYFVPEMLIAARAMQAGLGLLRPLLVKSGVKPTGTIAIGTVKGDLHDIGKNLVAMMLEGAGFEVNDLGTDVSAEQFIAAIQDGADIVGLSALLTTTMPAMKRTIQAIESAGLRGQVKIMIGGAPVTAEYGIEIGADGYAPDASQAATLALSLMS